jgi:hypothetical protein
LFIAFLVFATHSSQEQTTQNQLENVANARIQQQQKNKLEMRNSFTVRRRVWRMMIWPGLVDNSGNIRQRYLYQFQSSAMT